MTATDAPGSHFAMSIRAPGELPADLIVYFRLASICSGATRGIGHRVAEGKELGSNILSQYYAQLRSSPKEHIQLTFARPVFSPVNGNIDRLGD